MKAGLFDRAEEAYSALDGTALRHRGAARAASLHERSRDWRTAIEVAAGSEASGSGSFASRIAHYWCEFALEAVTAAARRPPTRALAGPARPHHTPPRPLMLAGAARDAGRRRHRRVWPVHRAAAARAGVVPVDRHRLRHRGHPGEPGRGRARHRDTPHEGAAQRRSAAGDALVGRCGLLGKPPCPMPASARRPCCTRSQRYRPRWRCSTHRWTCTTNRRCATCARPWRGRRGRSSAIDAQPAASRPRNYFWQCPGCLSWDTFPAQRIEEL